MLHKKQGAELIQKNWSVLKDAIQQVFDKNASDLSYEELFRSAYNLVLNRYGEVLYKNVDELMRLRLKFLSTAAIASKDESFLTEIADTWEEYRTACQSIRDILMYMDRNYVSLQQDKPQYYDLCLNLFKEVIIQGTSVGDRLTSQVISRIQKERANESIDRMLMKRITAMVHEMKCYDSVLEQKLVEVSTHHYDQMAQQLVPTASVPEYLLKVEEKLKEEVARVSYYLIEATKPKLESIIRHEMITKHMDYILENETSGFVSLVRDDKIQDLNRMYKLFCFHDEHLNKMVERFQTYISNFGKKYVNDDEKQNDPVSFIQGVVDQKNKYDKLLSEAFVKRESFEAALKKGFAEFADGSVQKRMAEFISLYVDYAMRKNYQSESEIEPYLDSALVLFNFLKDRDMFESYYKIHLSKRLLMTRSQPLQQQEAEKLFITKLKKECGHHFTSKIEGMFNDMRLSRESMEVFREHKAYNLKASNIDLYVNILTSSFWPAYTASKAILPVEMEACCNAFAAYYHEVHSGRKITWQKNLGDGVMIARFPFSKHEIIASTYQMIILLMFNNKNELTYKELADSTLIPEKELKRSLLALCLGKDKLIVKEEKSKNILDTEKFQWNAKFKSGTVRIRVGQVAVKESDEDAKKTMDKIDAERIPELEAAIVRVMKARQKMHHNELVAEVTALVQERFTPTPMEIKKRVESLIDREFLERDEADRQTFKYCA